MPGECLGQLDVLAQRGEALRVRRRGLLQLGELTPSLGGELEQDSTKPADGGRELLGLMSGQHLLRVFIGHIGQLGPQYAQDPAQPDIGGVPALSLEFQRALERRIFSVLINGHDRPGQCLFELYTHDAELTDEPLVLDLPLVDDLLLLTSGCGRGLLRFGVGQPSAQVHEFTLNRLDLRARLVPQTGHGLQLVAELVPVCDHVGGVLLGDSEATAKNGNLLHGLGYKLRVLLGIIVAGAEAIRGRGLCEELPVMG